MHNHCAGWYHCGGAPEGKGRGAIAASGLGLFLIVGCDAGCSKAGPLRRLTSAHILKQAPRPGISLKLPCSLRLAIAEPGLGSKTQLHPGESWVNSQHCRIRGPAHPNHFPDSPLHRWVWLPWLAANETLTLQKNRISNLSACRWRVCMGLKICNQA